MVRVLTTYPDLTLKLNIILNFYNGYQTVTMQVKANQLNSTVELGRDDRVGVCHRLITRYVCIF